MRGALLGEDRRGELDDSGFHTDVFERRLDQYRYTLVFRDTAIELQVHGETRRGNRRCEERLRSFWIAFPERVLTAGIVSWKPTGTGPAVT